MVNFTISNKFCPITDYYLTSDTTVLINDTIIFRTPVVKSAYYTI